MQNNNKNILVNDKQYANDIVAVISALAFGLLISFMISLSTFVILDNPKINNLSNIPSDNNFFTLSIYFFIYWMFIQLKVISTHDSISFNKQSDSLIITFNKINLIGKLNSKNIVINRKNIKNIAIKNLPISKDKYSTSYLKCLEITYNEDQIRKKFIIHATELGSNKKIEEVFQSYGLNIKLPKVKV